MTFTLNHDINVGERYVRLRSSGTGRPLIMVHDIGGSGASFTGLLGAVVAAGRSPVAMDLPGCGRSDPLGRADLAAVADHLQLVTHGITDEPIDIIGRGLGGYLALTLAAREPDRYTHLVLADPLVPLAHYGSPAVRMSPAMALAGAVTTVSRGRIRQNVTGYGRARSLLKELDRPDDGWWDNLALIQAKTLIVSGRSTAGRARPAMHALHSALRSAAAAELTSRPRPAGYRDLVLDFLTR